MRVFHFMQKKYALENIQKSRLKIATLNDMNDPYEFHIPLEGGTQEDAEKFRNHYDPIVGFLCFSRCISNPVQWAHYAEKHRGICMEFEIHNDFLLKVNYLKSPSLISAKRANWQKELVGATFQKYIGWKYEQEYRMPIVLSDEAFRDNVSGLYFRNFSDDFSPSKIYTGIRCELSNEETEIINNKGLPIIKMVQDLNSYLIVYS
jgi:hypothetical protein